MEDEGNQLFIQKRLMKTKYKAEYTSTGSLLPRKASHTLAQTMEYFQGYFICLGSWINQIKNVRSFCSTEFVAFLIFVETVDVKHQPGSQFEVDLNNSSLEPLLMVIATDIPQRYLTKLVDEPVSHKRLAYLTILLQEIPFPSPI